MKIAIFENEFDQIEYSFKLVNRLYYNDELKFEIFTKSQEFKNIENIINYDLIFIDLDLSVNSDLDGYSLIRKFIALNKKLPIVILTGAAMVEESLKKKSLPPFEILLKPLDYKKLFKIFQYYIKPSE